LVPRNSFPFRQFFWAYGAMFISIAIFFICVLVNFLG
jgi:hypothetical protein